MRGPRLSVERRQVVQLLASSPDGVNEQLLAVMASPDSQSGNRGIRNRGTVGEVTDCCLCGLPASSCRASRSDAGAPSNWPLLIFVMASRSQYAVAARVIPVVL